MAPLAPGSCLTKLRSTALAGSEPLLDVAKSSQFRSPTRCCGCDDGHQASSLTRLRPAAALVRSTYPLRRFQEGRLTGLRARERRTPSNCHCRSAGMTRTRDPSERLIRACEHISCADCATSISVDGSHCKVFGKSFGHMRHREPSLSSTTSLLSCRLIIIDIPHNAGGWR
jgi:hypothetical protein